MYAKEKTSKKVGLRNSSEFVNANEVWFHTEAKQQERKKTRASSAQTGQAPNPDRNQTATAKVTDLTQNNQTRIPAT